MFRPIEKQPTKEEPLRVKDYPYGFRLRTTILYWVESNKNGQRFVSQTINPKTGGLNKPKASTYTGLIIVCKDEKDHVVYDSIHSTDNEEVLEKWKQKYWNYLTEWQKNEFHKLKGLAKAWSKVSYSTQVVKYRNKITGEVSTSIPFMELNNWEQITKVQSQEEKDAITKQINKLGYIYAKDEGFK